MFITVVISATSMKETSCLCQRQTQKKVDLPTERDLSLSMHDTGPRRPVSMGGVAVGAEGVADAHVPEPAAVKREAWSKKRGQCVHHSGHLCCSNEGNVLSVPALDAEKG